MIFDPSGLEAGGGPLKPKSGKSLPKGKWAPKWKGQSPMLLEECQCDSCRRLDEITKRRWRKNPLAAASMGSLFQGMLQKGLVVVVVQKPEGLDIVALEPGTWKW